VCKHRDESSEKLFLNRRAVLQVVSRESSLHCLTLKRACSRAGS
jgi:hypothetical protein